MFNLYQSMSRRESSPPMRHEYRTGHDRFCRIKPSARAARRSKRALQQRTQSATELDHRAMRAAAAAGPSFGEPSYQNSRRVRTSSVDEEDTETMATEYGRGPAKLPGRLEMGEHTPLRTGYTDVQGVPDGRPKTMESLARLFSCVGLRGGDAVQVTREERDGLTSACSRHGGRYEYTALEDDSNLQERLELERKAARSAARERAHTTCNAYLRHSQRYVLLEQLNDIGSRMDKHWFVVRDTTVKTERLLTLVPRSSRCPIRPSHTTRRTLLQLFLALQHPYIYPVLDVDFWESCGQSYALTVLPFNSKGSLKDLIYRSRWQDDWSHKYGQKSAGLPVSQVQRLGRQILEALLFLRDRGFPPCGHLHSGNIILQNGVARLTGLENTLLGHTSRIHPTIWSRARTEPPAIDTVCFGHILFEMCAGYELYTPQPTAAHLLDIQSYPQVVAVLDFIFHNPSGRFPSIAEISLCDFFRNIDLRELRSMPLPQAYQARLTPSTWSLLEDVRRHQHTPRSRRSQSASTAEPRIPSSPSTPSGLGSSKQQRSGGAAKQRRARSADGCDEDDSAPFSDSSSPSSSLYATPHASLSLLDDDGGEEELLGRYVAAAGGAEEEMLEWMRSSEHRHLALHLLQADCERCLCVSGAEDSGLDTPPPSSPPQPLLPPQLPQLFPSAAPLAAATYLTRRVPASS